MKPVQIRLLIVIISVGLLALAIVQTLWITNALTLQKTNFTRTVKQSLDNLASQIEAEEARKIFINLAKEISPDGTWNTDKQTPDVTDQINQLNEFFALKERSGFIDFSTNDFLDYYQNLTRIGNFSYGSQTEFEQLLQRNPVVQTEAFSKLFFEELAESRKRTLPERVDLNNLDSLIYKALLANSITAPYTYEVKNADRNLIKELETAHLNPDVNETKFGVRLFPKDLVQQEYYLILKFKNQQGYFFQDISGIMLTSIITIIVIAIAFVTAINIIQKQKMLSEMKNDFINNMTHELKTPIATISLASEALLDRDEVNSLVTLERFGKVIYEENQRLKKHVERILNTALLDKSDFQIHSEQINLHEMVKMVIQQNDLRLQSKDAVVVTQLNATQPIILGDEMHLTNVVYNIIDNAIKYSKSKLHLQIGSRNAKGGVVLSFTDDGIGMSPSQQKKAFEKFYRVSTGDLHDVKGFGLGLSYVKRIVETHGGYIALSSTIDKGSTFEIYLPFEPINIQI